MAFSADFVTKDSKNISRQEAWGIHFVLTLSTRLVGLIDGFDNTNSDSLPHVTDGETTKGRIFVIRFNTLVYQWFRKKGRLDEISKTHHGLGRNEFGDASVTRLDEFGSSFNGLSTPTIDLLNELGELAGDVGSVAIEDWGVSGANLTRVVEDNNLSRWKAKQPP